MPGKKDFMLLSGKWGPYNVIGQCLDRVKRIKTDNLQRFLEYELENSQCRTETWPAMKVENIQIAVIEPKLFSLTEIYGVAKYICMTISG